MPNYTGTVTMELPKSSQPAPLRYAGPSHLPLGMVAPHDSPASELSAAPTPSVSLSSPSPGAQTNNAFNLYGGSSQSGMNGIATNGLDVSNGSNGLNGTNSLSSLSASSGSPSALPTQSSGVFSRRPFSSSVTPVQVQPQSVSKLRHAPPPFSVSLSSSSLAVESALRHEDSHARPFSNATLAVLLVVWFSACLIGALSNKQIMDLFNYPNVLTGIHLFTGLLIDLVLIQSRKIACPLGTNILYLSLPVAASLTFGKTLTFVSYAKVPASLTHTVKAAAPVFSVLLTWILSRKLPAPVTFLSLLPISLGVTLSAVSEFQFHLLGFLSAVLATFLGVLQSTYTKISLQKTAVEPLVFHLYTSTAALLMTFPGMYGEVRNLLFRTFSSHADTEPFVPWTLIIVSLLCHYLQNIASIYVLSQCNVLSHQVAGTFKRLIVIFGSVLYFGNPVSGMNVLGMSTALGGFFWYSYSRATEKTHHKHHKGYSPRSQQSLANVVIDGSRSS